MMLYFGFGSVKLKNMWCVSVYTVLSIVLNKTVYCKSIPRCKFAALVMSVFAETYKILGVNEEIILI